MNEKKRVGFYWDAKLLRDFQIHALLNGNTMTKQLNKLMEEFIKESKTTRLKEWEKEQE